jgi:hypothetical protein
MKIRRFRLLSLLVGPAAILGLAASCSSTSSTPTATTSAPPSTSQNFAVDTPDGQVSLSLNGALPPNWPASFPTPSGATPAGSGSLGGTTSGVLVGVYQATGSAEDAFTFYKNNSSLTVTNPSSAGVGSAFIGKLSLTGTYTGSVSVVGAGGRTLIVVVLKTSGTTGSTGTTVASSGTTGTTGLSGTSGTTGTTGTTGAST